MPDKDVTAGGRPCGCGQPFDAEKAHRALSRDVAALVDVVSRLSAARARGAGGERGLVEVGRAFDAIARALRIVGGSETTRFPACCCLGSDSQWFCSGTLIAPNVVLTAAHCDDGVTRAFVGGTNISYLDGGELVPVEAVVRHPEYDEDTHRNDIAVALLRQTAAADVVELATAAELSAAERCTLVGFGYNDPNRPIGFGSKREVDVEITALQRNSAENLSLLADALGFFVASEFVAGRKALGLDSCNGDSGGPAFIDTPSGFKLAGVTSRATRDAARPCGDGGIYVRVDFYDAWIRHTLRQHGINF